MLGMSMPRAIPRTKKFPTKHIIGNMHLQTFDGCSHPLQHKSKAGGS